MTKVNNNLIMVGAGVILVLGAGMAAPYSLGVTVVGGVMTAMGLKELLLK